MKYLVVSVIIVLLTVGCVKKEKDKMEDIVIEENKNGIVIEYKEYRNDMAISDDNTNYIVITSDKKITWGKDESRLLTDSEYNELIKLAFTESFKSIGSDVTDPRVMDGRSSYITLYYNNGETFKIGGSNPSNTQYRIVENKINSYAK